MTARDRIVLIVVGLAATMAAFWFLAISPKRKDAGDLSAQISQAQTRLDTAQESASQAEAAKSGYRSDYATVARLGKAVPVDDEMPSLVYQLEQTAKANHVQFNSIKLTSNGNTPTSAVAAAAGSTATPGSTITAALPPGATVGAAGFPTMPFSFEFTGKFFDMQRFVKSLDNFTTVNGKSISVKGRLLTVDGVSLKAGPKGFPQVDATVVVTSYLLPTNEGLTPDGATATAPSGGTATSTSTATASLIGSDR